MILQEQKKNEVEKSGIVQNSTIMTIDQNSIHLLMSLLSKNIYADAIGSTIREWVSNAWDATVKSGKNVPIMVSLSRNSLNKWEFSVEDKALGFDQNDVDNIVSKYLYSTKREDNTQLGAIGIGLKSGLAYNNSFIFTGRKNGVETSWMMYEDETENKIDKLYEKPTTEENGVKFVLSVSSWDLRDFSGKIREQLAYFSNVFIKDDNKEYNNEYSIFENDLFKWSENQSDSKMHVCLGEVYYPLDFAKLGISDIYVPIGIKVGLDEGILPTISRESFMMTPQTKELLLTRIKEISTWFVKKYNENVKSFETVQEAYPFIEISDKKIVLENKNFTINSLIPFSEVGIQQPTIKGIELFPIRYLKTKKNIFFKDYNIIAEVNWKKTVKLKRLYKTIDYEHLKNQKNICVGWGINISGYFKSFLIEKGAKWIFKKYRKTYNLPFFRENILQDVPKSKWRQVINEFITLKLQMEKEVMIDLGDIHLSEEFEKYKKDNKSNNLYSYSKPPLNKQKGEVTFGYVKKALKGNSLVVNKKVHALNSLHKLPYKVVLFMEEEKEMAKEFAKLFVNNFERLKVVVIGKREITKLNLNDKIMLFAQLKQKNQKLKLLKQIATAGLFKEVQNKFESIKIHNHRLIEEYLAPLDSAYMTIKNYTNQFYNEDYEEIMKELINKAVENNELDYTYWEEYKQIKNACEKLGFLRFFKNPDRWDSNIEEYVRAINEELLLRKLTSKYDLDMFEICAVHSKPVNEIEEIVEEIQEII